MKFLTNFSKTAIHGMRLLKKNLIIQNEIQTILFRDLNHPATKDNENPSFEELQNKEIDFA